MSRRIKRTRVELDARGIDTLSNDDKKTILRGADELIMSGGRTLLVKILKGSKSKQVLDHDLEKCPVYGAMSSLSNEEILAKIDWLILNRYLQIEYDGRLPLLVYGVSGWEIEINTYADELLERINQLLKKDFGSDDFLFLKGRNRGMIFLVLEKISATNNTNFIPALKAWKKIDYKKVKVRINSVICSLEGCSSK